MPAVLKRPAPQGVEVAEAGPEVALVDDAATGVRAIESVAALQAARDLVAHDAEAAALAEHEPEEPSVDSPLASWLYARWWAGFSAPPGPEKPLGGALEAARRSVARLEPGFLVLAADDRRLVAARVQAGPGAAVVRRGADAVVGSSRPGMPARPGDLVTLVGGSGGPDPDGAWWWAHTGDGIGPEHLARLYLHVRPEGATRAVAATVGVAEASGVFVSLKCPARVSGFGRRDAMVVYLDRDDLPRWEKASGPWLQILEPLVHPGCPPLTRRIAAGVSTAQDPGGGLSYGQVRCAQIAALVSRLRRDREPLAGLAAQEAISLLAEVGIDAAHPEEVRQ